MGTGEYKMAASRRSNHVGFLTVLVRGGRRTIELGWVTHLVTHINPVPDTPALPASPSDYAFYGKI